MKRRRTPTQPHYCLAPRCDVRLPRGVHMCRRHWQMLPIALRDAIHLSKPLNGRPPTQEYSDNISAAQRYVAQLESVQEKE